MNAIFKWTTTYPKTLLLVLLILTGLLASRMGSITMETDSDAMMPEGHPAILYNDQIEEVFGIRDTIIIGIVNEADGGVFNPGTLALVKRLTETIAALKGVVAVTDDDVISLATIDNIVGTESGFEVAKFMEEVPADAAGIAELKHKLYDNGMFVGGIISEDGTATAIYAELENRLESRAQVYRNIKSLVTAEMSKGGPEKIYVAGRPVLEVTFGDYMAEDMRKMMPIVIGVVIGVLFLTFRSLAGIVLPLLVVIGSVIWSMGIMSLSGVPLFPISTQMPVILMAVGTAYGIHILNKYFQERAQYPDMDKRQLILEVMDEIWKPVVMTGLTTAVGFTSLVTAYMVPIRYFGVFTAVGVLAAMLFSLLMIPAALTVFNVKVKIKAGNHEESSANGLFSRWLARGGGLIFDHRRIVIAATGLVVTIALSGLSRISTNSSWIEGIKHSSDVYIANDVLNKKFDGTMNLYVVVEGLNPGDMKSPAILRKIDALQTDLETMPLVGGTRSIAEYLKRMNRVMNEDRREFEIIPDSQELVAQYLFMYSMSGGPEDFDDVVDYDYRQANIWVQMKSDYTDDVAKIIDRVKTFADKNFPDKTVKVNLAGRAYTSNVWVDLLISGQMNSIVFSILAVFLITAVMFRSVIAGIFNIIPISAALLLNFGIMAMLGYPLDVSTALSSGIVIGVGIDYTIHFLSKYRLENTRLNDSRLATVRTMATTGRAIVFNALGVIAGFTVLYASNFPANQQMGGLVSLSMFTCFLAAMTILPALLLVIKPAFVQKSG
ncbi:MMPL family transporter [bacterium]|nr:MMPL family transporter [bacterium]